MFQQCLFQRRLRFRVFQIGAEDDEVVFDAFVQRGDFGVAQADVVGEEDFRHVGEQEGAVDGGDFDGVPVRVVFFGGDGDAWRNRHVAAAAADTAAAALGFGNGVSVDKAVKFCFERALDVGVVFGGVLRGDLYDEGVEDVVVFGDEGAGGEDVETVAAEDAAEAGEQARTVGHEDHDLEAVAFGQDAAADDGGFKVVYEVGGVPQDFAGLMAGEVGGTERVP